MGVFEEGGRAKKNGHSAKAAGRTKGQGVSPEYMEGERYRC